MKSPIKLFLSDDATRVEIKELIPGCTEEMVRTALEEEFITTGIQWDYIAQAVKTVNDSGEVLRKVVVATVNNTGISVQFGTNGPVFSGDTIINLRQDLSAIAAAIRAGDTAMTLHNGTFVKSGEIALTVTTNGAKLNVYGSQLTTPEKLEPFPKEHCISLKMNPEGYQFVAQTTGYLVINQKGLFDIIDPFATSDDKMTLFCYVIPMVHGREVFIDKIFKAMPLSASSGIIIIGNVNDLPETDHLVKFELRRGTPPVAGRPGSIRILIGPDEHHLPASENRIDHKEKSRFREIPEGTIIAERIPLKQSVPGINVFGEPIKLPEVKDIVFSFGSGIVEESSPDLIKYIAKEHGVLELTTNFLNVVPELVIDGDINVQTGNVKYSRSVVVEGNITSGFRVECGMLTVKNSVEDGAEVICTGDVSVGKGVIGEHTKITVSGNAKIGFVQGATLRISGDCTIMEYAYHSKIFCAKKLTIEGRGITSRNKGGIIGGTISSLEYMDLHSVGSSSTLTTLCCGFDSEGFSILMETINLEKTLKKKIVLLQNNLQFTPSSKDRVLQKIQHFSPERKEAMKTKLLDLRQTIEQVEKTDAAVALLSRKVFSADLAHATIVIRHHCISPVLIEFPKHRRKIYNDTSGIQFRLVDDEITMDEGIHCIDDTLSDRR